jgi:alkylhydroperoxidase family enzyme
VTVTDPRLARPAPEELRPDVRELIGLIAPPGRAPAETMQQLARLPELFSPFLGWAAALALHGTVPKRDHEILALRTVFRCASDYEFAEHVEYATDAGVTAVEVQAVAGLVDHPWSERDAVLLRLADELWQAGHVSDEVWTTLTEHYEPHQIVELLFVAGQYTMLSYVANGCGLAAPRPTSP